MTTSKNSGAAVSLKGVIGPAFYETHRLIRAGKIDEAVEKGGRASLKSSYVSVEVVLQLLRHPDCHALVTRQVADTMRDSVYAQILWAIDKLGLGEKFRCTQSPLQCVYLPTGQRILFRGLDDPQKIKSIKLPFGYMRIAASADLLTAENGRKRLRDDLFVGLEGSEQTVGITAFAPALRNENYEARRQAYLKAVENLLGVKRGILSDAEAVSKTATEINSSAGDYSLSIIEFQNLYYDALQAALRLADQLGQAYRLCDGTAWDTEVLNVTWGNGVLYDADKEWADRLAMVQQGMLRPELALAWKFDLPCDTEEDLAAIRQKYMPTMQDMES